MRGILCAAFQMSLCAGALGNAQASIVIHPTPDPVCAVAVGDLFRQPNLPVQDEIIVATGPDASLNGRLSVYRQLVDGNLALLASQPFLLASPRCAIGIADLDQDGAKDVVVSGEGLNLVFFDAAGGVESTQYFTPGGHHDMEIGDLDQNGAPDVVLAGESAWRWLANPARESQAPLQSLAISANQAPLFKLTDADRDGIDDLALAYGGPQLPVHAKLYTGLGGAAFSASTAFSSTPFLQPGGIAVADVDGNGLTEILYTEAVPAGRLRAVEFSPQPAARTLASFTLTPSRLLLADISGDGRHELLALEEDQLRRFALTAGSLQDLGPLALGSGGVYPTDSMAAGRIAPDHPCPGIVVARPGEGFTAIAPAPQCEHTDGAVDISSVSRLLRVSLRNQGNLALLDSTLEITVIPGTRTRIPGCTQQSGTNNSRFLCRVGEVTPGKQWNLDFSLAEFQSIEARYTSATADIAPWNDGATLFNGR